MQLVHPGTGLVSNDVHVTLAGCSYHHVNLTLHLLLYSIMMLAMQQVHIWQQAVCR